MLTQITDHNSAHTPASGLASSGFTGEDRPRWEEYSRCVHCGLCANYCPTYRELGVEMDSPRGRIYQMVAVDEGRMAIGESFVRHIDLCLDCRACETACPSGVEYGKLVEAARTQIEMNYRRPWRERLLRRLAFHHLFPHPTRLRIAGRLLYWYQASGLQEMVRRSKLLGEGTRLADLDSLAPNSESPDFFSQIGKTFPAHGPRRYRVAFHSGCIANFAFARLQEATIRVLQRNGCEVVVPAGQICCGALHVHAGVREKARELARRNIEAFERESFDAHLTNAAGCGSTLKEYGELLHGDAAWSKRAAAFSAKMKDVTEFLADVGLTQSLSPISATVTYQDSCHLLHGQKVKQAPRSLLAAIPGLCFVELPHADLCCGSAGIYNVLETDLSLRLLDDKMKYANGTAAEIIATANPGCLLQMRAGVARHGHGQEVVHVMELLDRASRPVAH
ncbi:MAG: (Fe-S)-binding protein [Acidobacteria bacterium]|nr:(Fe-S)-binding protein [Acidobacteriota bacterium]